MRAKAPLKIDLDSPFEFSYFAEGAAYIVYQIEHPYTRLSFKDKDFEARSRDDGQPILDPRVRGKLLRLRKNIPSAVPVIESHEYFKSNIESLFPQGMLVDQELCEVSPALLKKYNKELRRDEKQQYLRDDGRAGTYLAEDEPHGLLVTNMLYDDQHASCDFKPKWLSQSPSAPEGSKRCQLNDRRAFCPLSLTNNDGKLLGEHLHGALLKMRGAPIYIPEQVSYAIPFFKKSRILRRLRELQERNDPGGPLVTDVSSEKFKLAMTLRDCTMFMKASLDPNT